MDNKYLLIYEGDDTFYSYDTEAEAKKAVMDEIENGNSPSEMMIVKVESVFEVKYDIRFVEKKKTESKKKK